MASGARETGRTDDAWQRKKKCKKLGKGQKNKLIVFGQELVNLRVRVRQFQPAFPPRCIIPVTDSSHGGGGRGWISSCALKQHRSGDTSRRGRIARFDSIAKHNAGTGGTHTHFVAQL